MRTEDAQRSIKQLKTAYDNLISLSNTTNDSRYNFQAEGIVIAAKSLELDWRELGWPHNMTPTVVGE